MDRSFLARVVDVRHWLKQDTTTPFEQRLARERRIARSLAAVDPVDRVMAWWAVMDADAADLIGERVTGLARVAQVLLVLLGGILGGGVASVAFAYDGTHPVNLLVLLGVLVGLPFGLLLLTLVTLVVPGRIPGLDSLRDAFATVNPGRWVGAWLDRYSGQVMHSGFSGMGGGAFGRWQLLVFSQWLAIGYFAGVLLVGWLLVALTDLAFGWSSTLNLEAGVVHEFASLLAWPWQAWLPVAAPDLALVEASRYNRMDSTALSMAEATRLGQWWPFVLMTILVYGLLPRVVLLILSATRLNVAARELLLGDSEVVALLDRLTLPALSFAADPEPGTSSTARTVRPPGADAMTGRIGVLIWNQALTTEAAAAWLERNLRAGSAADLQLGAWQSESERAAVLATLPAALDRVLLFTKGWEPPLLEFTDVLRDLRGVLPPGASITVVPVDTKQRRVAAADREVWARALASHEDPRLYVMQAADGEAR